MKLTSDQVKHTAKLAKLPLTEEQIEVYAEQISRILDYIDQLNKVGTEGVEPTFNVTGSFNVMKKDEVTKNLTQDAALQNASSKNNHFFVTKGVFENE